jgi:hypothetical protein
MGCAAAAGGGGARGRSGAGRGVRPDPRGQPVAGGMAGRARRPGRGGGVAGAKGGRNLTSACTRPATRRMSSIATLCAGA